VSTLRGELADNGEWSLDPTTPAIILGTPDMIGSRLLFRGYGNGRVKRAQHAGLLGVDTLVVHDEAHLSPTFGSLLREIAAKAALSAERIGRPPLTILEMTATTECPNAFDGAPKGNDPLDRDLLCRLQAKKTLRRHLLRGEPPDKPRAGYPDGKWEARQRKEAAMQIAEKAAKLRNSRQTVAVFLDRPDDVTIVADRLATEGIAADRIAVLTGTMRGNERDKVASSEIFRRFLKGEPADETVYLICTSAGEIGLDIDAERLLCDLVTADRLIQRFGRANRRGLRSDCTIDLFEWKSTDPQLEATRKLLPTLPHNGSDASPLALSRLMSDPGYRNAIPPVPRRRRLEDPILELWAMTSMPLNAPSQPETLQVPEPNIFIHGLDERDFEVRLVWRNIPQSRYREWLEAWPIHRREVATVPIGSAKRLLSEEVARKALLVSADCEVITKLSARDWASELRPGMTLILPCTSGGLNRFGLPVPMDVSRREVEDVSAQGGALIVHLERAEHEDSREAWRATEPPLEAPTLEEAVAILTQGTQTAVAFSDPDISRAPEEGIEDFQRVTLWLSPKVSTII